MLVEIVKQLMDGVARRALGVVVQDQPVARVLLDQLAWREVVLEIDDHRVSFLSEFRAAGRARLAPECKPEWQPGCQPDGSLFSGEAGARERQDCRSCKRSCHL